MKKVLLKDNNIKLRIKNLPKRISHILQRGVRQIPVSTYYLLILNIVHLLGVVLFLSNPMLFINNPICFFYLKVS